MSQKSFIADPPQIHCLFCGADLATLYQPDQLDEAARCPRCRGQVRFVTDLAQLNPAGQDLKVLVDHGLIERPGSEPAIHLVLSWDLSEDLTTGQVAQILGIGQTPVINLLQNPENFPGAYRKPPSRPKRYAQGQWRIPRKAVWRYLTNRRGA